MRRRAPALLLALAACGGPEPQTVEPGDVEVDARRIALPGRSLASGELPAAVREHLPLPPGSDAADGLGYEGGELGAGGSIPVAASASEVAAFYRAELLRAGWEIEASVDGEGTLLAARREGWEATIAVIPDGDARSTVSVSVAEGEAMPSPHGATRPPATLSP